MRSLFLLGCIFISITAAAKDKVYWQTFHTPPVNIKKGEFANQGFADKMLALIIQELPDYDHFYPLTTHSRAMENMRQGKKACHPGLFMTEERKTFAYFSTASLVSPSINLIAKKSEAKRLALREPIDLASIFNNQNLAIGLVSSRSYGKPIDSVIAKYPSSRFVKHAIEEGEKMFSLVNKNRLAFTFAYSFELKYYSQTENSNHDLIALDIMGEKPFSIGYMACSKTPWGKSIITKLNEVLKDMRGRDEYINAMTSWIDEEDKGAFKAYLAEAHAKASQ